MHIFSYYTQQVLHKSLQEFKEFVENEIKR